MESRLWAGSGCLGSLAAGRADEAVWAEGCETVVAALTDTGDGRLTGAEAAADAVAAVSSRRTETGPDCCLTGSTGVMGTTVSSLSTLAGGAAGVRPKLPNCSWRLCSSLSEGNRPDGRMTGTLWPMAPRAAAAACWAACCGASLAVVMDWADEGVEMGCAGESALWGGEAGDLALAEAACWVLGCHCELGDAAALLLPLLRPDPEPLAAPLLPNGW